MTVNPPNPGSYFTNIGQHIVNLRQALNDLLIDAAYLNSVGGVAFLEAAPFSLSSTDATNFSNVISLVVPSNPTVQAIEGFISNATQYTAGN